MTKKKQTQTQIYLHQLVAYIFAQIQFSIK